MTRRRNPCPGVSRVTDRHGKVRWRFRRGAFSAYLPGPYGSADFRAAYEAALEGSKTPAARAGSPFGTLGWLIEQYLRSPRYANLSAIRKETLRRELDWLRREAGDLPFARLGVRHVEALMARKAGPTAQNSVKKTLSLLFNFGIHAELAKHNPARAAERRKENPEGYHTWTEAEIARFLAMHGPGTKARLALMIFLCTGASRQDAARLGWQNVSAGRIRYRRGKTGIEADLPILPELAEELRHVPADRLLFLTHGKGRSDKPETLGNWFKAQCKAAGLPHCSAHGLRKAGARRIAEQGGTEHEVMAFMAHATPKEGATYTKKASRARLADNAAAKVSGTKPERTSSNLSGRLDKRGT
jgi:integrase